jgi:hypothetical protein
MRHSVDPQQPLLFDPYAAVFSAIAYRHIQEGWQGVFRHVLLELMPVQALAGHFSPDLGRPTKELYSMAGLQLIMEFNDWTLSEASHAYMFYTDVQYALNLDPAQQSCCVRTLERYRDFLRDDDLASQIMHDVTLRLAQTLELDIDKQRLDSTHIYSNMATFGRTRLMGVTIKRFLTQVKRHAPASYQTLPEALRQRYQPSEHRLFGDSGKDADSRARLRQQVAEDLYFLVEQFATEVAFRDRPSYGSLVLVFQQQCTVEAGKVTLQKRPGGNCLQNPSDPDATYDGKKGSGYQVQLTETCSDANEVQLITSALPETAVNSDAHAVAPVLQDLEKSGLLPKEMLADTAYGSDENVQLAAKNGVELISPVAGPKSNPERLNADDFVVQEGSRVVECCPAGHEPVRSDYDADKATTTVIMPASACGACPFRQECPVKARGPELFELQFTDKEQRLEERRREEATPAFRERYAKRSGIEGTNSGLKRRVGLGQLRVRGSPSVFPTLLLKITGWNILRAAAAQKMRHVVAQRMAAARKGGRFAQLRGLQEAARSCQNGQNGQPSAPRAFDRKNDWMMAA